MTRRRRTAPGMDSLADLESKVKILEREMALQRKALERLKQMGSERGLAATRAVPPTRKTA